MTTINNRSSNLINTPNPFDKVTVFDWIDITSDDVFIDTVLQKYNLQLIETTPKTGSYGEVYFVTESHTGEFQVIKKYNENITGPDVLTEISLLIKLDSYDYFPKVLKVCVSRNVAVEIDSCQLAGNHVALIMTYCGNTFDSDFFLTGGYFPFDPIKTVVNFIQAYHKLYIHGIVHRDLKNNNICLGDTARKSNNVFIIDLGYGIKLPYISTELDVVDQNRNMECFTKLFDTQSATKIDLLSIYNTIVFIFNIQDRTFNFPRFRGNKEKQLKHLLHLICASEIGQPSQISRKLNLVHKVNDLTKFKYQIASILDTMTLPDLKAYQKIIRTIPPKLYRIIKKLLNINPSSRMTFRSLYRRVQKLYPQYFDSNDHHVPCPSILFHTILELESDRLPYDTRMLEDFGFQKIFHPSMVSMIFYHYHLVSANNQISTFEFLGTSIPDHNVIVFEYLYYLYYSVYVNGCHPKYLGMTIDHEKFTRFWVAHQLDLFPSNPHNFKHLMWLVKWTDLNNLTFDYILITTSMLCPLIKKCHPYIVTLILSVIILRKFRPIEIDDPLENTASILLPAEEFVNIPLTKNTLRNLVNNSAFIKLVKLFYHFLLGIMQDPCVTEMNEYFVFQNSKFQSVLDFYQGRYRRTLKVSAQSTSSVQSTPSACYAKVK